MKFFLPVMIIGLLFTSNVMAGDPYKMLPAPTLESELILKVMPQKRTPSIIEKSDLQWCHKYFENTPRIEKSTVAIDYCLYLFKLDKLGKIK